MSDQRKTKVWIKQSAFSVILMAAWISDPALATTQAPEVASSGPAIPASIASQTSKNQLRVRYLSEYMSPPLSSDTRQIPKPDGSDQDPSNYLGVFWADYEFAPKFRVLYYQRLLTQFTPDSPDKKMDFSVRDPRFALRYMNQFLNSTLTLTVDAYVQPGWSRASSQIHKVADVGYRATGVYTPSGSRFTLGALTDLGTSFYSQPGEKGNTLLGVINPFVEYTINDAFNTEHWLAVTFYHKRNASPGDIHWDDQAPYVQNGITWNASRQVSVSALLNNYLEVLPTLQNTWVSLWLNINFI